MIKEVIVVEGKDDIAAVKRAVDADLIATSGFGINDRIIERIKSAAQRRGIIIFTDPDYAGEKIRRTIQEKVPGCKHAFLPREKAIKDGDIGIENASPESIREALAKVKTEIEGDRKEFTMDDLIKFGLTGSNMASSRRDEVGKELGIGYGNAKQFLNRLNRYGITREEFTKAIEKIDEVKI
ncbi:DNA primase [Fervidicella metallireducens AeB]|uniref:Ribonuclease M5 n=1 Tax=Fervidicella metallireducens AeB TaxID=1403537 RepID=A0A017RY99_9CLOT|nr:ribonuclease M5 [Fervidicella metallireducens]EYE89758.1 DNA primase [Fervidicella metallireducens AeB]